VCVYPSQKIVFVLVHKKMKKYIVLIDVHW
jgi:hypothetical protein